MNTKNRNIIPLTKPINTTVSVPGSKSLTNRALLLAALANGTSSLNNALFSDDSIFLANALQKLGLDLVLEPEGARIKVNGLGGNIPAKKAALNIGNAGTAARFLSAFLTLGTGEYILDGNSRMRERPISDLIEGLNKLGANIEAIDNNHSSATLPIRVSGAGLPGGETEISGDKSSQFLSALLMIAPYAKTPVRIEITTEMNSKPYIDMTLSVMSEFGVEVEREKYKNFQIVPACYQPISNYIIESDASAASYFFAAPAICGGSIRIKNMSKKSKQGDIGFLDILEKMGCAIQEYGDSVEIKGPTQLTGINIDMQDISDTAQTLAVIAPFASTPTHIFGIASSRLKETDRISATCTELRRVGVQVDEHKDGMTIYPADQLHGAKIHTYNDHRMAMAFSLIGLRIPGISIENPGCVSKTFPGYFEKLESLR